MGRLRIPVLASVLAALAAPAIAGPPYVTDDPEPTDLHRWEIYVFGQRSHVPGDTSGSTGLDLNYGGAKDLQLTLVLPIEFEHAGGTTHWGAGDIEAAAKWKFLHQAEGTAMPDVAFFPRAFIPTADDRFGTRHLSLLLPLWIGKDYGPWSVFGGGGYQINPGDGNRDFWTGGLAVTRTLNDRFSLGAEVYHQTRDADDARDFTGLNVGMTFKLNDHWSLLASGGPGVQNAKEGGQYSAYVSLKADY